MRRFIEWLKGVFKRETFEVRVEALYQGGAMINKAIRELAEQTESLVDDLNVEWSKIDILLENVDLMRRSIEELGKVADDNTPEDEIDNA